MIVGTPRCKQCDSKYQKEKARKGNTRSVFKLTIVDGTQQCRVCKNRLPQTAFYVCDWGAGNQWCRECTKKKKHTPTTPLDTLHLCATCKEMKPLTDFPSDVRGRKTKHCRECKRKPFEDPIKWVERAAILRANNKKYGDKRPYNPDKYQRRRELIAKRGKLERQYKAAEKAYIVEHSRLTTQLQVAKHNKREQHIIRAEHELATSEQRWQDWIDEFRQDADAEKILIRLINQREETKHDANQTCT
jgi:hypothetical protein